MHRFDIERPILIYNECCPFCSDVAHLMLRWFGDEALQIVPNTDKDIPKLDPALTFEKVEKNVHLVLCDMTWVTANHWLYERHIYSGGGAIAYLLALKKYLVWMKWWYKTPILGRLIDLGYWILKKTKGYYNNWRTND